MPNSRALRPLPQCARLEPDLRPEPMAADMVRVLPLPRNKQGYLDCR